MQAFALAFRKRGPFAQVYSPVQCGSSVQEGHIWLGQHPHSSEDVPIRNIIMLTVKFSSLQVEDLSGDVESRQHQLHFVHKVFKPGLELLK